MTLETSKTAIAEMFLMKNCFVTIFLTNEIGGEYDNFGYESLVVGQEQNFIFFGGVRGCIIAIQTDVHLIFSKTIKAKL